MGKWLKIGSRSAIFHIFREKPSPLKKNERSNFIFYYKHKNSCQFRVFMFKNDNGNMSESGEFRF